MAVVRANHEAVLGPELQQVLDVIDRVDGHEEPVAAEQLRVHLPEARQPGLLAP